MKKLIFILSIILLFQCSNDDSKSETPYSDISVDYVYPENNADTIPINHQFLIYFDQPITPDELKKRVILSTETDGETKQIWYNVERYQDLITHETMQAYKICVIKPSNLLEENKEYTLTINKGLLSTEHGQLKETFSYSFTTAQDTISDLGIIEGKDRELLFSAISKEYNQSFIKLWYKEHLNPYYINKRSILLQLGDAEYLDLESVQYNPLEKSITVYPQTALEYATVYWLRIACFTDKIYDLGRNERPGGGDIDFTLE